MKMWLLQRLGTWRLILPALVVVITIATLSAGKPVLARVISPTPDSFRVAFETSRGRFVVMVRRSWAPIGAERFHELVEQHFFDNARFFRTLPGFVAQFGLNADPKHNEWMKKPLKDDPVKQTNAHGTLTFASMMVPNTRSQQLFINLRDNPQLDGSGFAPIGKVIQGLPIVDSLFGGYGESPDQDSIQARGNAYLTTKFPKLDFIKTARIVGGK
jgi:cyclophilin family peptidyl-prolyl cis-trans isomerase